MSVWGMALSPASSPEAVETARPARREDPVTEPGQSICRFYQLIADAPPPRRAARGADGKIPLDAYRYCEPLTTASAFGWYLYPPLTFSLLLDDDELFWRYEGAEEDSWMALQGGAQYPGFADAFDELAPNELKGLAPPLLVQGSQPGQVQIWSGYLARTIPGWALLSRGVANATNTQAYRSYEGILETSTWFGPLFTNLRITRTNAPVFFHKRDPLVQIQPLRRECYLNPTCEVLESSAMTAEDWRHFEATVRPNTDHMRARGRNAASTRKHLREAGQR